MKKRANELIEKYMIINSNLWGESMKISGCMIVKNESKNIARCINSYKKIVDEIIVVDTGSTDNTVEIAEELGAKVFFRKWDNDFAAAKNYALDRTNGDWIIFLDADEYFSTESLVVIKQILKKIAGSKSFIQQTYLVQYLSFNQHAKPNQSNPLLMFLRIPYVKFFGKGLHFIQFFIVNLN